MTVDWHKAMELDELPEGRVTTVTIGTESLCLTHFDGKYGALDNHCPHQGGPLGEEFDRKWFTAMSMAWLGLLPTNGNAARRGV